MRIAFGSAPTPQGSFRDPYQLQVAIPALGKQRIERIVEPATELATAGHVRIARAGGFAAMIAEAQVEPDGFRAAASRIYADVFAAVSGLNLYRVWNYAPRINQGEGDLENYRQFCLGRSEAFEMEFGTLIDRYMPAGTCVGCDGDTLVIVAIAGEAPPEHFENPKQIPAYQYPREYGPRAPSFARASSVRMGDLRYRYISGTAAVLGHASIGLDDLDQQMEVTCDNLDAIIAETLEADRGRSRPPTTEAQGKVYIRKAEDYPKIRKFFEQRFPAWSKDLIYLRSDICRQELLLEAEFSFVDVLKD